MIMKTRLLCDLLECGYLDINFLDDLLEQYNISLDFDDIKSNYWKIDINILIFSALEEVKNQFIESNKDKIEELWFDINDLDYEIYTNYIDSHIWFNDNQIDDLYQEWR